MPSVRVSVVIAAPPAQVWRVVEDIAGHVDWMTDAVAIRFTSHQRSGVGTTFDCDTKIGPFRLVDRMEVTDWRPRKAMGVTHRGVVTGRGRFTLMRASRGRTRFTWRETLDFPLWFGGRVGALVAKPVLTRIWRQNLAALKAQVEAAG
jgi:uncharacterized protein YndB with AHSA1/START domain